MIGIAAHGRTIGGVAAAAFPIRAAVPGSGRFMGDTGSMRFGAAPMAGATIAPLVVVRVAP